MLVMAAIAVVGVLRPPSLPVAAESVKVERHARGRVAPRNAAHLRRLSTERHGATLRRVMKTFTPPAAWDSVSRNWVPPIEDQGQCGSCWDFSGTGMVDIAYSVAGWPNAPAKWVFSEQYTLDCGRNGGCGGDDNTTVLQDAQSNGLPLTADYGAYTARSGRCHWTSAQTLYKVQSWGYADPAGQDGIPSAAAIKSAIMLYGCVGCAVAAGNGWDSYSGGVYAGSGNRSIDHDVILVGWDDSKSPVAGKTVWKMRNSWGADWGDHGYMWIVEGADLVGTEAVWCAAPAPPTPPTPTPTPPVPPVPPMPGAYWSGTITYQDGMILSVSPAIPTQRRKPCP